MIKVSKMAKFTCQALYKKKIEIKEKKKKIIESMKPLLYWSHDSDSKSPVDAEE